MAVDLGDLVKQFAWDVAVRVVLAQFFIAVPWLAWQPMRAFITLIVTYFSDRLFDEAHEWVDIKAIKFGNANEEREFNKAAVTLKIIAQNKGADSKEYANAHENAVKSFVELVRYDSAA